MQYPVFSVRNWVTILNGFVFAKNFEFPGDLYLWFSISKIIIDALIVIHLERFLQTERQKMLNLEFRQHLLILLSIEIACTCGTRRDSIVIKVLALNAKDPM